VHEEDCWAIRVQARTDQYEGAGRRGLATRSSSLFNPDRSLAGGADPDHGSVHLLNGRSFAMSIVDEVRSALQPLIDQGVIHSVQPNTSATYSGASNQGEHVTIAVMVNADDPEPHRVDIMKLVLQAGLKVDLRLHPNPSRA
jgi:hypothetical protein